MARLNIKKAIRKPGQLHKDLGVPQGEKIPPSKLRKAAKGKGKTGQRARFAMTLKGLHKNKKMPRVRAQGEDFDG